MPRNHFYVVHKTYVGPDCAMCGAPEEEHPRVDITDGLDSTEYVRRLRDPEWQWNRENQVWEKAVTRQTRVRKGEKWQQQRRYQT